ncbi:sphingomyelin phosphodiesterase 4 [Drosophila novamexicana]|uniref:sphingomyelin phosphodiesterase 4 n=1 Tax=Drosophila novamexicana TaxID=47314 RepID=UPI0011E5A085|nr:sphingomyelin phosphodiesterase 4 [Drosophila novamexicana]
MSQPMPPENINSHILTVLSLPLLDKLPQLELLFDRCTVRQIEEIYPLIVHSIFGINGNSLGWGLRITTMENASHYFNRLQHFLGVNGIWMHVCHRLLNETTKFDIDINLLPRKFISMLQAGPMFYSDLINIDPLKHQVSTLSLNAFDFYMFHFVLYALQPLHTVNPIAMQIHNERAKTIYQFLAAEYLDNFLPQYPDARIEPSNFSTSVKAPQQLPAQSLQPQRQLRYLKLPSSYRNGNGETGSVAGGGNTSPQSADGNGAASRAYAWRSESVLHFFVDIWLRYDIESEHHLPSSDFVRGVRTLVKQIHFFANAARMDHSPLCALRKLSLTMVKARIYAFLCSLIDRWPLDSSLSVVLELWLSYIQPWRYTLGSNNRTLGIYYEPPITNQFDGFIIDNLIVYTHIFMQLLPRFERLDYSVYRNAFMLHRLAKTFSQQDLVDRLQRFERLHSGNAYGFDSPQRQVNMLNKSHNSSYNAQWNPLVSSNIPKLFSEQMHTKIQSFLYVISMARNSVLTNNISALRKEILERQRSEGYLKNIFKKFIGEATQDELTLRDLSRIPEVLRHCIDAFCRTFNVDPGTLSMHETLPVEPSPPASPSLQNFSFFDSNNCLDTSKLTPHQMSLNASNMQPTVDPALLPIKSNEIRPLVRLLHLISEAINDRYGRRIEAFYEREDFYGKLSRQVLYAPMTEKWFEKSDGNVDIYEKQLPPRISLRPLGSIPSLCMMAFALCFGHLWFGVASVGLLLLCAVFFIYCMLLALLS